MKIFKKEDKENLLNEDGEQRKEKAAAVLESLNTFTEGNFSTNKQITLLQKDVETLHALVDGLREMNKDDQERFQKADEGIGEIRNMLFDKEQELKDLKIQVGKAIDLVENAQVEKVLIEKKREDAKIQAIEAKLDSYKALLDSFMNEVKSVRTKIDMFKGVEQIIALNNEVKGELTNIQKIQAQIAAHSDKMENIFVDFNKKYTNFSDSHSDIENLRSTVQETARTFNKVQIDLINIAKREDLVFFEKEVSKKLHAMEDLNAKIEDSNKRTESMLKNFDTTDLISSTQENFKKLNEWLKYIDGRINSVESQSQKMQIAMNQWLKYLQSRITTHEIRLKRRTLR
jgi:chromosome segregation ATPase